MHTLSDHDIDGLLQSEAESTGVHLVDAPQGASDVGAQTTVKLFDEFANSEPRSLVTKRVDGRSGNDKSLIFVRVGRLMHQLGEMIGDEYQAQKVRSDYRFKACNIS